MSGCSTRDFRRGNPDPSEAIRHLATQAVCWLSHAFARERDLGIHRLNDLLTPWGGPNADNVYHYAAIDDQSTYRLHGRMGSCEQWLLALRRGNLHQKENGTLGEGSATRLRHRRGRRGRPDPQPQR